MELSFSFKFCYIGAAALFKEDAAEYLLTIKIYRLQILGIRHAFEFSQFYPFSCLVTCTPYSLPRDGVSTLPLIHYTKVLTFFVTIILNAMILKMLCKFVSMLYIF